MTNSPIYRIPLEDMTEMGIINCEVQARGAFPEPGDALAQLIDHTGNQEAISITLDWAMQLREKTGQDWGTCISVAMTAYFG